ncbi:MAG: hypothetical protein AAGF11_00595 [Myxococcota bacterium]
MNPRWSSFLPVSLALTAAVVSACDPEPTRSEPAEVASAPTVLERFEPGSFLESVERDGDGNTYVTVLGPQGGDIIQITPDGERRSLAQYPAGAIGTVVLDAEGRLFGTMGSFEDPEAPRGIVRVDPDGTLVTEVELPVGSAPNGITADTRGNLYVADSFLGVVWRRVPGADEAQRWAEGDLLAVLPDMGFPGPNGIKVFEGEVYVSNPSQGTIVRIPIQGDGSAGEPVVHAVDAPADDFALDIEGNLYATTHPFNTLLVVSPQGDVRTLLTSEDGMWGPTAAIFGERSGEQTRLYIVTDGNMFAQLLPPELRESDEIFEAEVLSIDVGIQGAPVPGT